MAGTTFHGHCLTVSDHDRLRIFVNEMAIRGLVPHIERTIRALTDQVLFDNSAVEHFASLH